MRCAGPPPCQCKVVSASTTAHLGQQPHVAILSIAKYLPRPQDLNSLPASIPRNASRVGYRIHAILRVRHRGSQSRPPYRIMWGVLFLPAISSHFWGWELRRASMTGAESTKVHCTSRLFYAPSHCVPPSCLLASNRDTGPLTQNAVDKETLKSQYAKRSTSRPKFQPRFHDSSVPSISPMPGGILFFWHSNLFAALRPFTPRQLGRLAVYSCWFSILAGCGRSLCCVSARASPRLP